jgi:hypothetical protein
VKFPITKLKRNPFYEKEKKSNKIKFAKESFTKAMTIAESAHRRGAEREERLESHGGNVDKDAVEEFLNQRVNFSESKKRLTVLFELYNAGMDASQLNKRTKRYKEKLKKLYEKRFMQKNGEMFLDINEAVRFEKKLNPLKLGRGTLDYVHKALFQILSLQIDNDITPNKKATNDTQSMPTFWLCSYTLSVFLFEVTSHIKGLESGLVNSFERFIDYMNSPYNHELNKYIEIVKSNNPDGFSQKSMDEHERDFQKTTTMFLETRLARFEWEEDYGVVEVDSIKHSFDVFNIELFGNSYDENDARRKASFPVFTNESLDLSNNWLAFMGAQQFFLLAHDFSLALINDETEATNEAKIRLMNTLGELKYNGFEHYFELYNKVVENYSELDITTSKVRCAYNFFDYLMKSKNFEFQQPNLDSIMPIIQGEINVVKREMKKMQLLPMARRDYLQYVTGYIRLAYLSLEFINSITDELEFTYISKNYENIKELELENEPLSNLVDYSEHNSTLDIPNDRASLSRVIQSVLADITLLREYDTEPNPRGLEFEENVIRLIRNFSPFYLKELKKYGYVYKERIEGLEFSTLLSHAISIDIINPNKKNDFIIQSRTDPRRNSTSIGNNLAYLEHELAIAYDNNITPILNLTFETQPLGRLCDRIDTLSDLYIKSLGFLERSTKQEDVDFHETLASYNNQELPFYSDEGEPSEDSSIGTAKGVVTWERLSKNFSIREGDFGKHCGNRHAYTSSDDLFSLRMKVNTHKGERFLNMSTCVITKAEYEEEKPVKTRTIKNASPRTGVITSLDDLADYNEFYKENDFIINKIEGRVPKWKRDNSKWRRKKPTKKKRLKKIVKTERKPKKVTLYFMGESKGYNNTKFPKKAHPYMVDLLCKGYIDFIVGGGHAEHQNFYIADLSKSDLEKLKKYRPDLFNLDILRKRIGNQLFMKVIEDRFDVSSVLQLYNEAMGVHKFKPTKFPYDKKEFPIARGYVGEMFSWLSDLVNDDDTPFKRLSVDLNDEDNHWLHDNFDHLSIRDYREDAEEILEIYIRVFNIKLKEGFDIDSLIDAADGKHKTNAEDMIESYGRLNTKHRNGTIHSYEPTKITSNDQLLMALESTMSDLAVIGVNSSLHEQSETFLHDCLDELGVKYVVDKKTKEFIVYITWKKMAESITKFYLTPTYDSEAGEYEYLEEALFDNFQDFIDNHLSNNRRFDKRDEIWEYAHEEGHPSAGIGSLGKDADMSVIDYFDNHLERHD